MSKTDSEALSAGRLPHFFLVGAPKCATSSLHMLLRQHPSIFMCSPKEPHYFSTDMPGLREVRDRDEYCALFATAPPDARLGEASAFYLSSRTAAENITSACPDARIVISLRHPVEAAQSLYHQLRDGFREDATSFANAWRLQEARAEGRNLPAYCPEPAQLQYRDIYSYNDQIVRYFAAFGRENVLVLRFERIHSDPDGVMDELLRFIGVSPFETPVNLPHANTRREALIPGLGQFLAAPPALLKPFIEPGKRMLNRMGIKPSEIIMKHLSRPAIPDKKQSLDSQMRAEIAAAFMSDVERLETTLQTDLTAWKR